MQFLLVLAVALTVGLIVFGITVLVTGDDPGLAPVEPDGRPVEPVDPLDPIEPVEPVGTPARAPDPEEQE